MDIEILLGGLVGLSFIAVLIYLLTRRDTSGGGTVDSHTARKMPSEEEGSSQDDRT